MQPGDTFVLTNILPGIEPISVKFVFVQPGFMEVPEKRMFDLLDPIPGHPVLSTVSETTLEDAGFVLPK